MIRPIHTTTIVCIFLFTTSLSLRALAQEPAQSPRLAASDTEALRHRLEKLEAMVHQLEQTVQSQSQLIERQNSQLQALQQRTGADPVMVAARYERPSPESTAPMAPPKLTTKARVESLTPETSPQSAPAQDSKLSKIDSGYGTIMFNGLLQGWYAAGNGGFRDTFRIRRAEPAFSGQITPKVRWALMFDLSKALSSNNAFTTINGQQALRDTSIDQGSRILEDAFITLDYIKNVHVNVGQFKLPLSLEGYQGSAGLDTVERALFLSDGARGGRLGDVWDLGVLVNGPLNSHVDYYLGVYNGVGENQNDVDKNDQKIVSGRIVMRPPFIKGLQIGGSGAWSNGGLADHPRRDRLGGDVLFTRGPFKFKSEVMTAKDFDLHRLGYYTHFGYKIAPKVEGIFRFDSFDPDRRRETSAANVTERDYIMGVNYYIHENNVKLQFNYLRKTFDNGIAPSRNLILVNLQTSWW